MEKTNVVVIGAGSTGAALVRDLAMRGINTILVERGDLCGGTTGKCHGMLHSGGRYAVNDPEAATECIEENLILQKIGPHVIELTGGLFVGITDKDLEFKDKFLKGCKETRVPAEEISTKEALKLEPYLNPEIKAAIKVPDGALDPFRFVISMCLSAKKYGADIRPYTEVIEILKDKNTVFGVKVKNHITGEIYEIQSDVVASASGPWAGEIAKMAGVNVPITPTPGIMVVIDRRVVNMVINRLRKPSDGDIIVPHNTTAVIGTTSWPVQDPDELPVPRDHVELMIKEGSAMVPIARQARLIRAFAAARPLIAAPELQMAGREISRRFECFDHEVTHGLEGFLTITGGKMVTARAMAETTSNIICKKLGVKAACRTAEEPLVGSEETVDVIKLSKDYGLHGITARRSADKYGTMSFDTFKVTKKEPYRAQTVCTCEFATRAEIDYAVKELWAHFIDDVRRRTRVGMGICQGGFCSYKVAGILTEDFNRPVEEVHKDLMNFLWMRWAGLKHIAWDQQLRQESMVEAMYAGVGNYDKLRDLYPKMFGPSYASRTYIS